MDYDKMLKELIKPVPKVRITLTFTDGTMVGQGDVDFAYLMNLGDDESPGAVAYAASLIWLNWLKGQVQK